MHPQTAYSALSPQTDSINIFFISSHVKVGAVLMVIYHCGISIKRGVCAYFRSTKPYTAKSLPLISVERHPPGHIYSYFSTSESTEVKCSARSFSWQVHRMQKLPLCCSFAY